MIKNTEGNWLAWPECSECKTRRLVQCSVCLADGTDFRLADMDDLVEEVDDENVLLLCSTCDEPFLPQFYRECTECGFDFGEGIESDEPAPEELNGRVLLVIGAVVLSLVGLLIFFSVVLSR